MEFISSSTLTNLPAELGSAVSDNVDTLWPIVLIVVSIPLAFYVLKKVIGLFPKK